MAIIDTKAHFFTVGQLPDDVIYVNIEAYIQMHKGMVARLVAITEEGRGDDTDEGAMIVTFEGYIQGVPKFFTNDATTAFRFKDRAQAESFIAEFSDALRNPQVLDHP